MCEREKSKMNIKKIIFIITIAVIIVVGVSIFFVNYQRQHKDYLTINELFEKGTIFHNGKYYSLKKNIDTYLLMGIDDDGGQADIIYLIAADNQNKKIFLIPINRNIMVAMDIYSETGEYLGQNNLQICLAHSIPCRSLNHNEAQKNAVSNLLFGLQIDNYVALHEDGIESLANIMGDINITLNETLTNFENVKGENNLTPFENFVEGETLTVNSQNISAFFRIRELDGLGGSEKRLERVTDYIIECYNKLSNIVGLTSIAKNLSNYNKSLDELYREISNYISTDITNPVKLVAKYLANYTLTEETVFYIPHITGRKNEYEVCYMNEEETREILLHIFYKEALF